MAKDTRIQWKVIYTAYSKKNFFLREHISKFVLSQKVLPLNPFMNFNYFLGDSIDRSLIYIGNSNLIRIADEIWSFGEIADGVASEIDYCSNVLKKDVKYFDYRKQENGMYEFFEIKAEEAKSEQNSQLL